MIERVKPAKLLGLTATPTRLDNRPLGFDTIAYQRTFLSLVEAGFLARPHPVIPKTELNFEMRQGIGDFDQSSLAQLNTPERNHFVVRHWRDNRERYGKTLVFALNKDHARTLAGLFEEMAPGARVRYVVSGDVVIGERNRIVEAFQQGEIDVLVNCQIFTEGFDCPDIRTIMLARPTLSKTLYLQMVGRGTRVTSTKRTFYLVDFEDQLGQFQETLVRPWVLDGEQPEGEKPDPEPRQSIQLPEELEPWLEHDLAQLSDMVRDELIGYVTYTRESGRADGFLVHSSDETSFRERWGILSELTSSPLSRLKRATHEYTAAEFGRITLDAWSGAAIALARGEARFISLRPPVLPDHVLAFLEDCELEPGELTTLAQQIDKIAFLAKFTEDVLGSRLIVREVFSSEGAEFAWATEQVRDNKGLRGEALETRWRAIHQEALCDTGFTSYEWRRLAEAIITGRSCVLAV